MLFELQGKMRVKKETSQLEYWVCPMIWTALFSFLLILTFFDIGFQKKEAFVKLSVGVSPWRIIASNIVKDLMLYVTLFLMLHLIFNKYTYIYYRLGLFIGIFAGFLLANSLSYFVFLKYDLKKVLSGKSITDSLRGNCYIIKIFTMILTMIVVASNVAIIKESITFLKQNSVIENYKEYSFIKEYFYYGTKREENYADEFMKRTAQILYSQYREGNVALSVMTMEDLKDRKYICVNKQAKYSIDNIKEIDNIDKTVGVHIFIPEDEMKMSNDIADFAMKEAITALYKDLEYLDYEIISYSGQKDIIYFNQDFNSKQRNRYITLHMARYLGEIQNRSPVYRCAEFNYKFSELR